MLSVNGEAIPLHVEKGYASIDRRWREGDFVTLRLPMKPQFIKSHPNVEANRGKLALQRGPLLYCTEEADNAGRMNAIFLDDHTIVSDSIWENSFDNYCRLDIKNNGGTFIAIPYYAWSNRGSNQMRVWIEDNGTGVGPMGHIPTK